MKSKNNNIIRGHHLGKCLTRKVLVEKTRKKFSLLKFNLVSFSCGVIFVDNFIMPESMYIFDEPPIDVNNLDVKRIVAISEIEKHRNGYYAINIKSIRGTLGDEYIKMLHKGQIGIHLASTGIIVGQNNIVENFNPICLYLHWSQ